MMKRVVTFVPLLIALAGCANFAPDHSRPGLASSPAYDPELRPDGTLVASQLSYRDWFIDARLERLIANGLENNRDLLAASARIEQARARYRIQESRSLPTWSAMLVPFARASHLGSIRRSIPAMSREGQRLLLSTGSMSELASAHSNWTSGGGLQT